MAPDHGSGTQHLRKLNLYEARMKLSMERRCKRWVLRELDRVARAGTSAKAGIPNIQNDRGFEAHVHAEQS
jgi:hypothetical protein